MIWTAFITACYKKQMVMCLNNLKVVSIKAGYRTLMAILLLCFFYVEIILAQQTISPEPSQSFDIKLSDEVTQAINSGVPLSFSCQLAVRESFWLFSINKQQKNHHFLLTRHALSNRYIVKYDNLDTPHIFRTVSEATNYIALQAESLLELYSNEQSPFSIRVSLNKFELPGPMRLNAFISESWNLDTGWIVWNSAN